MAITGITPCALSALRASAHILIPVGAVRTAIEIPVIAVRPAIAIPAIPELFILALAVLAAIVPILPVRTPLEILVSASPVIPEIMPRMLPVRPCLKIRPLPVHGIVHVRTVAARHFHLMARAVRLGQCSIGHAQAECNSRGQQ